MTEEITSPLPIYSLASGLQLQVCRIAGSSTSENSANESGTSRVGIPGISLLLLPQVKGAFLAMTTWNTDMSVPSWCISSLVWIYAGKSQCFQRQYGSRDITVPSKFQCHIIQCHVPMLSNWSTNFAFISLSRHFRGHIWVRITVFVLCVRMLLATNSNCGASYIFKEQKWSIGNQRYHRDATAVSVLLKYANGTQ